MVQILVIDYDNTAVSIRKQNPHEFLSKQTPHLLSQNLVAYAQTKNYDGFYGCTHRCFLTDKMNIQKHLGNLETIRNYVNYLVRTKGFNSIHDLQSLQNKPSLTILQTYPDLSDINTDDQFVTRITENFSEASGLTCIKVSTPDDGNGECGSGYEKILKPYEEAALHRKNETVPNAKRNGIEGTWTSYDFSQAGPFVQKPVRYYAEDSKNKQLLQIATHAANKYPGEKITLDYVDDNKSILDNALLLEMENNWPENVVLNVHYHDAFEGTPIMFLGTISKEAQQEKQREKADAPGVLPLDLSLDLDEIIPLDEADEALDYDRISDEIIARVDAAEQAKNRSDFKETLKKCLMEMNDHFLDGKLKSIPEYQAEIAQLVEVQETSNDLGFMRQRETLLKFDERMLVGKLQGLSISI